MSTAQPSAQAENTPPLVAHSVIAALLGKLSIDVTAEALSEAAKVSLAANSTNPVERLNGLFQQLQLRGVNATIMRWHRFDQSRLPALILLDDEWQLIEHDAQEQLTVRDGQGTVRPIAAEQLSVNPLIWVRVPKARPELSLFSTTDNIAAKLVLGEIFKKRRWLADVLIATVIINILAVATSLFAMQVYDRVVPTLAYATLWTLVAGMAIVIALDWTLKTVRARILDSVAHSADKNISQSVFDHVMHLQLDSRPRSLGTLAAQISGLDSVRQFFTSGVIFALVDMPFALMFVGFIAVIGGPIAWVYLLLLPVAALLGFITQRRLRGLMKRQLIRSNERQGLLVDAIQGTETIRTSNSTWRFAQLWREVTTTLLRYNIQQKAISNFATVTTGTLSSSAYILALVVGVGQIASGNLTMGALIACSILGGRVIAPIAQSVQFLTQWENVSSSLQMVNQVLLLERERKPDQTLLIPDQAPAEVRVERLRFCYPESPIKQLEIYQLNFKAGDRVALVGAIGCGKSTLLKVLAGLYRPTEGRIQLGQADLWETDPAVIANHVGYLPQSVHLFKGTLRSNLLLAGAASDSQLLAVMQQLDIDTIVNNSPKGLDHEIYEGGDGLSGGQKQLVGLARVALAQPTIWLLDEPTASLDNETERKVLDAIEASLRPNDILVLSTHRPLLANRLAKRIIHMEAGRIAADGPAEQVLQGLMGRKRRGQQTPQGANNAL